MPVSRFAISENFTRVRSLISLVLEGGEGQFTHITI
jgi:hypothetical protein